MKFFWYDVMTRDVASAEAFYTKVLPWSVAPAGIGPSSYSVFSVGDAGVAGAIAMREVGPAPETGAFWSGYIYADDVDVCAKRIVDAGGSLYRGPWDTEGVGRFAVMADPDGAKFLLMRPSRDEIRPEVPPGTPGYVGRHELHATDLQRAFAFYSEIFGWTKGESMDIDPIGTYQMFEIDGVTVGGMMQRIDPTDHAFWLYYFTVDGIDAALARVEQYGGHIARPATQVPGGSWVAQCSDPQGGYFSLASAVR